MAKNKSAKAAPAATASDSKRAGYKRKKNGRVDVLGAQLMRLRRAALNEAATDKSSSITK